MEAQINETLNDGRAKDLNGDESESFDILKESKEDRQAKLIK